MKLLAIGNNIFAEGNAAHKIMILMGKAHCIQHGYMHLVEPADKIMEGLAFYTKPAMKFMSQKLISGIIHAIYYMIGKSGLEAGIGVRSVPDNLHGTGLSNRSLYEIAGDGVDDAVNQSNFYGIVWMSIQIAMSLVSDKSNSPFEAAEFIEKASQFQPHIPSGRTREEYGAILRAVDYVYQFSPSANGDDSASRKIVRDLLKYDRDNIVDWFEQSMKKGGD